MNFGAVLIAQTTTNMVSIYFRISLFLTMNYILFKTYSSIIIVFAYSYIGTQVFYVICDISSRRGRQRLRVPSRYCCVLTQ